MKIQNKVKGVNFIEKIRIDTDKNTERFHVPKHLNLDEVDILNDFGSVSFFCN